MRLIPFIYSSTIPYPIQLGEYYASFYYGNALLDTDGALISTPYSDLDLPQLQYRQLADTMWLMHKDFKPQKLTRTSAITFSIDPIVFSRGPFKTRNDLLNNDSVTMTYDHATNLVAVGSVGTLTASSATFESGHVGSLFNLNYPRDSIISQGQYLTTVTGVICAAIDVKGSVRFKTRNTWTGTVILERNENGTGWETYRTYMSKDDYNESFTWTENSDNVQYRATVTSHTSGTLGCEIVVNTPTQNGVVRIDSVTSFTVAVVTVMEALPTTNGLVATYKWSEGEWSDKNGYPCSMAFLGGRCIYTGNGMVHFSSVGDYENFEVGVLDADAFSLRIPTQNEIRWIDVINNTVVIGTSGDEWSISSNKIGSPLTPSNFLISPETTIGSSAIQPIRVNNSILFVDYVGRKLREFTFNNNDKLVASDMTVMAEHISASGIVWMSLQKNPDYIVWCGLANGDLKSMTFEREQNVVAWSNHPMDSDIKSGCVIPGDDEDEVWFLVNRVIDGSTIPCVERMAARVFDTKSDCHFVDCGIFYNDVLATVFDVSHLSGETVSILADGMVVNPQVVSSGGTITLTTPASKVHIGKYYRPQVSPMRLDTNTNKGSTHGSVKKISELVLSVMDSEGVKHGDSLTNLYDVDLTTPELINKSDITGLYTGDVTVHQDGGFSIDDSIIITSSDPLPLTVRAIIVRTDVTGR